jgi:hypothetical protein
LVRREFGSEFFQAIEIFFESEGGIEIGVVQDTDGSIEAHFSDSFEDFFVSVSLSDWQDLFTDAFTIVFHAVEVDRQEVGFDFREDLIESIELMVCVV